MVYIEEKQKSENTIHIRVDGTLDAETIPVVKEVVTRHLSDRRNVWLELEGVVRVGAAGMEFLKVYRNKVRMSGLTEFVKLEVGL